MLRVIILLIFISVTHSAIGQITLSGIDRSAPEKPTTRARTEQLDTLSLPFWDDFSFTFGNTPLDSLWQNSDAVYVGDGIGNNPPSIGVASLDGVRADGTSYSGTTTALVDSLTSCPIDLSGLSVSDEVYLSFFYQFAGNGEAPEENDSLRVEMKTANGNWVSVWPAGSELNRSGNFTQELVRLDSASFFHAGFQFRFQSFGRPTGFFDLWNIDYVYVNRDRSPTDNRYPDRTIATPTTSIFEDFYALPAKHFTTSQLTNPTFQVTSVADPNSQFNPKPYATFFSGSITDWENGNPSTTNYNVLPLQTNRRVFTSEIITENYGDLFSTFQIEEDKDSIFIELITILEAGDNEPPAIGGDYAARFEPIDFRSNDTIRNQFILKDYYAYDDGTAEVAAGLNFSGNRLAIRFPIPEGIQDTIIAVDMHFPLSQNDPNGRSISLVVWEDDSIPGEVIYREDLILQRGIEPNQFIRYTLKNPVVVSDTFFIGYRQNNEGRLALGYDLSRNSRENIFYNVGNLWQPQPQDLTGSFMLRPVFGRFNQDTIVSVDERIQTKVNIYPNPTTGKVTVEGRVDDIVVLDMLGRAIVTITSPTRITQIDLTNRPNGLYFVRFRAGKQQITRKLIKR